MTSRRASPRCGRPAGAASGHGQARCRPALALRRQRQQRRRSSCAQQQQPAAAAAAAGGRRLLRYLLQALFDLEATNNELKADLRDLYITGAKEVDVAGSARKAIIVHVRRGLQGLLRGAAEGLLGTQAKATAAACGSQQ